VRSARHFLSASMVVAVPSRSPLITPCDWNSQSHASWAPTARPNPVTFSSSGARCACARQAAFSVLSFSVDRCVAALPLATAPQMIPMSMAVASSSSACSRWRGSKSDVFCSQVAVRSARHLLSASPASAPPSRRCSSVCKSGKCSSYCQRPVAASWELHASAPFQRSDSASRASKRSSSGRRASASALAASSACKRASSAGKRSSSARWTSMVCVISSATPQAGRSSSAAAKRSALACKSSKCSSSVRLTSSKLCAISSAAAKRCASACRASKRQQALFQLDAGEVLVGNDPAHDVDDVHRVRRVNPDGQGRATPDITQMQALHLFSFPPATSSLAERPLAAKGGSLGTGAVTYPGATVVTTGTLETFSTSLIGSWAVIQALTKELCIPPPWQDAPSGTARDGAAGRSATADASPKRLPDRMAPRRK